MSRSPPGRSPGPSTASTSRECHGYAAEGRGDLLVEVQLVGITDLDDEQAEALRRFAELHGESPAAARKKRRFFTG